MNSLYAIFACLAILCSCSPKEQAEKNPLDNLPATITQLTSFGERAAWSPDGKKIAFIKQSFNDAFEIDLETKKIRNLTESCPYHAFLRIQYLPDGNFLLIGPEVFKNADVSRGKEAEFWGMPGDASSAPVKLGERVNEGVAISRTSNFIAWAVNGEGMYTAVVTYKNGKPVISEKKKIREKPDEGFNEPQDFRNGDTELIHSHYYGDGLSDVMGINLKSGAMVNYTASYPSYDEPEGIFPGGEYTCVESDRSGKGKGSQYIDIWKLKLDGSEQVEQLTHFTDYPGFKASNPVISPDGKTMAFQVAKLGDPAGFGRGILLYYFESESKYGFFLNHLDSCEGACCTTILLVVSSAVPKIKISLFSTISKIFSGRSREISYSKSSLTSKRLAMSGSGTTQTTELVCFFALL